VPRDLPADQHGGAPEPTDQPDDDSHPERSAPQEDTVDQGDPDRDQRDDQRDDAGVHPEVLRDDRAPAEEQHAADGGGRARSPAVGRRHPRRIPLQPIRIAPATQDRIPGPTSGGILWLDRSSARYVVPQKKYTTPSPLQIRAALGELGWDISAGYGWEAVR